MGIVIDNVSKSFGGFQALSKISVDIPKGSLVALLGPSGSGKSTLLRVVAGLEPMDHGRVWLSGRNVTRAPVQFRQLGFVFQQYALFKHMTVYENMVFGLRLRDASPMEVAEQVSKLVELLDLSALLDRYPGQLSGGQQQRVALARALAPKPKHLLLDEPFGALDPTLRADLREWLRALHADKEVTTLWVTHDQKEAMEIADDILLLEDGRMAQVGPPEMVYDRPASSFVASFLGPSVPLTILTPSWKGSRAQRAKVPPHCLARMCKDPVWARSLVRRPPDPYEMFLRPHELAVSARAGNQGSPARLEAVTRIGSTVRLHLWLPQFQWRVRIEMGRQQWSKLGVRSLKDTVYVRPRPGIKMRSYRPRKQLR